VRAAAAQVLELRVPLDEKLTAADVKQAFQRSGVLFEPRLAGAQAVAPQGAGSQDAPAPANDLKAALLVFRQVVKAWATTTEPAETVTPNTLANVPALTGGALKQLAASLGAAAEEASPRPLPPASDQAASLAKTLAAAMLA